MYRLIICCLTLFCNSWLLGQSDFVRIDDIQIEGNRVTRAYIIKRELLFKLGDTIPISRLADILRESEKRVLNTSLFNKVEIVFQDWEGSTNLIKLKVEVEETWYIYPIPLFELADRNFNVWWVEQDRSLDRINFGLEFAHLNFTGRKDKFKIKAEYGYTRQYSMSYNFPFINKKRTLGLSTNLFYARNRELNYLTIDNKQAFYEDEDDQFIYQRLRAETRLTYRPGFDYYHNFTIQYHQNRVTDSVATYLNPNFFLKGRQLQRFFSLNYTFIYDTRDVRTYPLAGNFTELMIEKDGIGIFNERNGLTLAARFDQYFPLATRWFVGLSAKTKVSIIRSRQPYNDNRAIGFGRDFLHGYEYYIVDGLDMAYLKSVLRFSLWQNEFRFGKIMPIKAFRNMPIKLFLNLNNDFGYANDPFEKETNFLNNRLLWGAGLGLDIVLFYDKVLKIEYSFNHLFENGLFLHINLNI